MAINQLYVQLAVALIGVQFGISKSSQAVLKLGDQLLTGKGIILPGTADLFAVTFTCEISDPGAPTTPPPVKETFLLLRPTWADPVENSKLLQDAKNRIAELQGIKP